MNELVAAYTPNRPVSKNTLKVIIGTQVGLLFLLWAFSPFTFLPSISATWTAFTDQWLDGLGGDLGVSLMANLEAIGIACGISLILAYLTVLDGVRPIVDFI